MKFAILQLFTFISVSAFAHPLLDEVKRNGYLCDDGLTLSQYYSRAKALLNQNAPGSFFFRTHNDRLDLIYSDDQGELKIKIFGRGNSTPKWNNSEVVSIEDLKSHDPHLLHPLKVDHLCHPASDCSSEPNSIVNRQILDFSSSWKRTANLASWFYTQAASTNDSDHPYYRNGDPIFDSDGQLKANGESIFEEEAEEDVQNTLQKLNLTRSQLHGAQLFHGSTSASFYKEFGRLVPSGQMRSRRMVSFSGEHCVGGLWGMCKNKVATVWAGALPVAIYYACQEPWKPEAGLEIVSRCQSALDKLKKNVAKMKGVPSHLKKELVQAIRDRNYGEVDELKGKLLSEIRRRNIENEIDEDPRLDEIQEDWTEIDDLAQLTLEERRIEEWAKLTESAKQGIISAFPIVYGIRTSRNDDVVSISSANKGELGLTNGATIEEIRVVFVPENKVAEVQALLHAAGHTQVAVEILPEDTWRTGARTTPQRAAVSRSPE